MPQQINSMLRTRSSVTNCNSINTFTHSNGIDNMNYKRIYDLIVDRAKERVPEGYVERHHIVPRCLGGSDERDNLVALTPEEHFLCHVLLVKIYPEHSGLIYAVQMMCTGHTGKRKRRKLYGWLKRKFSSQRKIDGKGSGNTQHGTMWINKVGTVENKKIPVTDDVPEGWAKGRVLTHRHVYNKKCENCSKEFTSEHKDRRFCSNICDKTFKTKTAEKETVDLYNEFIGLNCSLSEFARIKKVTRSAICMRFKRFKGTKTT